MANACLLLLEGKQPPRSGQSGFCLNDLALQDGRLLCSPAVGIPAASLLLGGQLRWILNTYRRDCCLLCSDIFIQRHMRCGLLQISLSTSCSIEAWRAFCYSNLSN